MSEASGGRDYSATVGRAKRPSKGEITLKAVKVTAALGVAGAGTALVAKGIHDNQQEYAARLDYNTANQLNEQRQEAQHTKYFKQRREDDGYVTSQDGKRTEVFNRIIPNKDREMAIYSEPSQMADRVQGFKPVEEFDGSILGEAVYGDPFVTGDGKGQSDVLLTITDKGVDRVGYWQAVTGVGADGKKVTGFTPEDSSLHVVKSIKDPTRNQGVIKVDLTK